ncbi:MULTISPECIES: response regulator [unclassified Caballeronia]|uniref:response regulator n=1 Tax=unclassified Caballeronia TaxID=2646786 RepID=UPI001F3BB47F|nr:MULTISPECIES: response regulator [unclassified Caballeronia]MCE4546302.1 response regulator [Caballeronia sp. PC1]MCE4573223.1 response regulator [Caballeronia sp. CLC5]
MMRENKIEIIVADDRPVVLYGLQSWFESHERIRITACVRSMDQLLGRLKSASFDLIVLSGGIEGSCADGFAPLRTLAQTFPAMPVIAFTEETDAHALARIQLAGAAGLVSTRDEARAFERVCERTLSGAKRVVSPRIASYCDALARPNGFDAAADYRDVRVSVRKFIGQV